MFTSDQPLRPNTKKKNDTAGPVRRPKLRASLTMREKMDRINVEVEKVCIREKKKRMMRKK